MSKPRTDITSSLGRVAVIATTDIAFGMSRMHEILSEMESPQNITVFRDTGSALKWLEMEGLDVESIFEEIKMSRS